MLDLNVWEPDSIRLLTVLPCLALWLPLGNIHAIITTQREWGGIVWHKERYLHLILNKSEGIGFLFMVHCLYLRGWVSFTQFYLFSSLGWKKHVEPSLEKDAHSPWKASLVIFSTPEEEWSLWDEDLLLSLTAHSNSPLIIHCMLWNSFQKPHVPDEGSQQSLLINLVVNGPISLQPPPTCCTGTLFWEDYTNIPGLLSAKLPLVPCFIPLFYLSAYLPSPLSVTVRTAALKFCTQSPEDMNKYLYVLSIKFSSAFLTSIYQVLSLMLMQCLC